VTTTECLVLSTKRLVAAAKFLVAATKILFFVPNLFVAVTKTFFFRENIEDLTRFEHEEENTASLLRSAILTQYDRQRKQTSRKRVNLSK